MAITKIHPIKSTLNLAINYITNSKKTGERIHISSNYCHYSNAHLQFMETRKINHTKGSVLARHLIQSFAIGETSAETAHEIGKKLCDKILRNEYEYVLTTHIDKGHIHNHIIFNNVNFVTGKCYQSNKRSYHKIRRESDQLCSHYELSVIDEHYESFKNKYKTKGKGYYEYQHHQKGTSWKSKLQFTIDNLIDRSKTWEDFFKKMEQSGYEIKYGKHIAFKHKDKQRFTRAKTIGEDYTEEALKHRLQNKSKTVVDNLVKTHKNKGKGYEVWARKHNLKMISNNIYELRKLNIHSKADLDNLISEQTKTRQAILNEMKVCEDQILTLSQAIENIHTMKKYQNIFDYHRDNRSDSLFRNEYQAELLQYQMAVKQLKASHFKMSDSETILTQLHQVHEKKSILLQDYSNLNGSISALTKLRKNFTQYMDNDRDR